MGFGSYDESEQENNEQDTEEDVEAVNVHQNDHDGEVSFESEGDTDDLLDKLDEIKSDDE